MYYTFIPSPIGQLMLAGTKSALTVVGFPRGNKARGPEREWERTDEPFRKAAQQLGEYFAGQRREFDIEMAPDGTPFQIDVLNALMKIPYGETCSYSDIAEAVGRPKAVRAVGSANGRNPLPILIPCHRVIGRDGDLTGFGGGLPTKRYLLDLERSHSGLFAQVAGH